MSDYESSIGVSGSGESVEIVIHKDHADGLVALAHWCQGFEKTNGRVPGSFELVMHIREIRAALARKRVNKPDPAPAVPNRGNNPT